MAEPLVNKVVSFFTGDEGDSEEKMILKTYVRDITSNRYSKFFKPRTEEFDPAFAIFIYDIYKTTYPARVFLQEAGKLERLKQISIEAFMDRGILDVIKQLTRDAVKERMKTTSPRELVPQLKEELFRLQSSFDETRKEGVNRCFNQILALEQLATFDFIGLLKKFDQAIPEGNFMYAPRFQSAKGQALAADVGEFLAVTHFAAQEQDWKIAWEALKFANSGKDVFPLTEWQRILADIRDVKGSAILDYCMRFSTRNPVWQWKPKTASINLTEEWLELKRKETQKMIDSIASAQKNSQMEALVKAVFGEDDSIRLSYYVPKENAVFEEKECEGFTYAAGLNYLHSFLQDVVQKDVQELCDLILIRGQWTNNTASMEMSTAFNNLRDVPQSIDDIDQTLSEEGDAGSRLRASLLRVDRDKTQKRYINSICAGVNSEALEIINDAAQNLIVIGKHFKALMDDSAKKPSDLLTNWKELNAYAKDPLVPKITEAYKKINYFVQLMRLCTQ